MEKTTVTVKGLTEFVGKEDLTTAFEDFGAVKTVVWKLDNNGDQTGIGYIVFSGEDSAQKAISAKRKGVWPISSLDISPEELDGMKKDQEAEEQMLEILKNLTPAGKRRTSRYFGFSSENLPATSTVQQSVSMGIPLQRDTVSQQAQVHQKPPKLPPFSGNIHTKDASFARWQYRVRVLKKQKFSDDAILTAINMSLKSPAADILVNIGDTSMTTDTILQKFANRFGSVQSVDHLREQLYSLCQGKSDITTWSFTVEELVYLLHEKGGLTDEEVESTTKSRFWYGLEDSRIREATRHSYKSLTFDNLLVECRSLEAEYGTKKPTVKVQQQSSSLEEKLDKMFEVFQKFDTRLSKLEAAQKTGQSKSTTSQPPAAEKPVICTKCKTPGHLWYSCKKDNPRIVCNKCKAPGHLANGCRNLNLQ